MNDFEIKSEKEVKLAFHSRQLAADGWLDSYEVTAKARDFEARITVENPPYGQSPASFFLGLANEWSGWKGKKEWSALEGEYNLVATCDSLGHVTLMAELNPNSFPPSWSGCLFLVIEADQLEALANDAKEFFNGKP